MSAYVTFLKLPSMNAFKLKSPLSFTGTDGDEGIYSRLILVSSTITLNALLQWIDQCRYHFSSDFT